MVGGRAKFPRHSSKHARKQQVVNRLPEAFEQAIVSYRPNVLCDYLFRLARDFNKFYMEHRVLDAEGNDRRTRLNLVEATARVLETGLGLLGIQPLERM